MEKISIFGITTDKSFDSYEDYFEDSNWSGDNEMYYISKETFHHDEDELSFDYKYIIEFAERYWENKEDYAVTLHMVILPQSCCKKHLEKVAQFSGIEVDEVTWYDLLMHGGFDVVFGRTTCENEDIDKTILEIAHVLKTMDGLFGFYMDKSWNRIGSNGWDNASYAVLGTDLFKPAEKRCFE